VLYLSEDLHSKDPTLSSGEISFNLSIKIPVFFHAYPKKPSDILEVMMIGEA